MTSDWRDWLESTIRGRWGSPKAVISDTGGGHKVCFYTSAYRYVIYIRPPSDERPKGYVGAQVTARTSRVGEDWTRGNDLTDGPYSESTWRQIMADILEWELLPIPPGAGVKGVAEEKAAER